MRGSIIRIGSPEAFLAHPISAEDPNAYSSQHMTVIEVEKMSGPSVFIVQNRKFRLQVLDLIPQQEALT